MLRYLYARELAAHPALARAMFTDRAAQFSTRLGWPVAVDSAGEERDAYDACDPLYVICTGADGRQLGSLRFLPTRGRTMLNDHFGDLLEGAPLSDGKIWECTRFCLAPGGGAEVSAMLMLGADDPEQPGAGEGPSQPRALAVFRSHAPPDGRARRG